MRGDGVWGNVWHHAGTFLLILLKRIRRKGLLNCNPEFIGGEIGGSICEYMCARMQFHFLYRCQYDEKLCIYVCVFSNEGIARGHYDFFHHDFFQYILVQHVVRYCFQK